MRYRDWLKLGRRLRVRDRYLFVIDHGKGPAVLCLHGFPTSSHDYAKVFPLLAPHYRLIFFDFLGFGDSDKPYPYDYSIFEQADLAEAVLRGQGVSEAFVMAHDLGDSVAQELLRRGNALSFRINKLLLMNGGMVLGAYKPMLIQELLQLPLLGDALSMVMTEAAFKLNIERLFAHAPEKTFAQDAYESILRHNGKRCYGRLIRYLDEREEWNDWWMAALSRSTVPVELVWGMQDPVSTAKVAHAVIKRVLRAQFTPLGSVGHFPQWEAPDRVAERALAFFK